MRFLAILIACGVLAGCGFLPNDPEMACKGSRMQCSESNSAERFCKAAGIQTGTDTFAMCMVQHQRTAADSTARSSTAGAINNQNLTNTGLQMMRMGQGGGPVR